jgi:hypothetical protein
MTESLGVTSMHDAPSCHLSIVLEWENQLRSGRMRAVDIVRELSRQAGALEHSVELVVVADAELAECDHLAQELVARTGGTFVSLRVLAVSGARYYGQKNIGAAAANGELIVFCDSDARPEPAWLRRIVAAFEDPDVEVVSGSTYVETTGTYSKAMAPTWIFPLRQSGPAHPSLWFFANNVAFRSAAFPGFPSRPDQLRGACEQLARQLAAEGHRMVKVPEARTVHPPPRGLVHFVRRAMAHGHDDLTKHTEAGATRHARVRWVLGHGRHEIRRRLGALRAHRTEVRLAAYEAPTAALIVVAYTVIATVGGLVSVVAPRAVPRFFSM